MKKNEDHLITQEHILGDWTGKDNHHEITLHLDEEQVKMTINGTNGQLETIAFPFGGWWFDDYLTFINNSRFYISYATESEMEIAELSKPGSFTSGNKWEMKLSRVTR